MTLSIYWLFLSLQEAGLPIEQGVVEKWIVQGYPAHVVNQNLCNRNPVVRTLGTKSCETWAWRLGLPISNLTGGRWTLISRRCLKSRLLP